MWRKLGDARTVIVTGRRVALLQVAPALMRPARSGGNDHEFRSADDVDPAVLAIVEAEDLLACDQPVLDDPVGYIAGGGHDKRILFGAFLELLLIISNIGTAVVIVPIMWRRYKDWSIAYVTARLFECGACGAFDRLLDLARARATRGLSADERRAYLDDR